MGCTLTTSSSSRSQWWILQELREASSRHTIPFQALGTQHSASSGLSVLPRPWGGGVGCLHVPTLRAHSWGTEVLENLAVSDYKVLKLGIKHSFQCDPIPGSWC
ncbi:hypothetical protein H1C71_028680 [Ictidomys tridecemlineatus]|nr:hypothetical protein H1C71_028680 [Ictidomys tridecemlineatus]